jgi:hypothetical protein
MLGMNGRDLVVEGLTKPYLEGDGDPPLSDFVTGVMPSSDGRILKLRLRIHGGTLTIAMQSALHGLDKAAYMTTLRRCGWRRWIIT